MYVPRAATHHPLLGSDYGPNVSRPLRQLSYNLRRLVVGAFDVVTDENQFP